MRKIHGWINFDKPKGMTSFKAVSLVKKKFFAHKAGHAGTLDPLATGVLPIALGEATKTTSFLMNSTKTYFCLVRWGQETNTDDEEGKIINVSNKSPVLQNIKEAINKFKGKIDQVPPNFSAIKVNGKRSFKIARSGYNPNLKSRNVFIYEFKFVEKINNKLAKFYIKCSKGTYIRSLVRDLGRELGVFAHVKDLRRSSVGNFIEKNSISLDHIDEVEQNTQKNSMIMPFESALVDFLKLEIDLKTEKKLMNGVETPLKEILSIDKKTKLNEGQLILAQNKIVPIALCKFENENIKPFRVLNI